MVKSFKRCAIFLWMTNDKKFLLRIFRQNEIKAIFTYNFFCIVEKFLDVKFLPRDVGPR